MGTCGTCKHWKWPDGGPSSCYDAILNPPDPDTYDDCETENEIREKWGTVVRYCMSPKVLFYQRPQPDEACVVDGSQYLAKLITGEQFGCVNHEESEK